MQTVRAPKGLGTMTTPPVSEPGRAPPPAANLTVIESRKRRQNVAYLVMCAGLVLAVVAVNAGDAKVFGIPMQILGLVSIPVVFGTLIFSFINWRCPICEQYLGHSADLPCARRSHRRPGTR